jgi:hypothetical protein
MIHFHRDKVLLFLLKIIIFIGTLFYIYKKLGSGDDFKNLIQRWSDIGSDKTPLWIAVLLLMPLNWGLEALKWKYLISKLEKISFLTSLKAIFSGITINNWVPNRMAEFLGRILYLKKNNRSRAVFSTLVGSYAQLLMTLIFGVTGYMHWLNMENNMSFYLSTILALAISGFFLYLYLNISLWAGIFNKIPLLRKIYGYINIISTYTYRELKRVLFISAIRYLVFLFQYFLLLQVFNIAIDPLNALGGIALIFLIQALIPAITLTEIGIRGAVVIFVFEKFSSDFPGLLSSAYSLWLINIIIPTIIGAILVFTLKRKKT